MFVNGFLKLIEAGIIRREVYGDETLQRLINEGRIAPDTVNLHTLRALLEEGRIGSPLREVVYHKLVLEMDHADIAAELGLANADSARALFHKALARLRERLESPREE